MNFGLNSIKHRIIFLSALLAILLFSAVIYTQQIVKSSSENSLSLVYVDQELFQQLNTLKETLKETERTVYQYSLLHEKNPHQNLDVLSSSIVYQADTLMQSPITYMDDKLRSPIFRLRDTLIHVQYELYEFINVAGHMETLYPAMPILRDDLYPINVEFMKAAELAIDEADRMSDVADQRKIHELFIDLRHNWVQQISSVRIFIANRLGAFGDPLENMTINEGNRQIFSEGVDRLLVRLDKYLQEGKLEIQQEESLEAMKTAKAQYEYYFEKVAKIYLSDGWRTDLAILRNKIRPSFAIAWRDLGIIENRIYNMSVDNVHGLVGTTDTLSDFIWVFAFFAYALLIGGYYMFEFSIRRPILQISKGMKAFGKNKKYAPKFYFNAQETNVMLEAFYDMQDQVDSRQQRLESILDNAAEGIITVDENKCIETFNNAAQRQFGYSLDEIVGQDIYSLLTKPVSSEDTAAFASLFASYTNNNDGAQIRESIVMARRKDGSLFPLSIKINELHIEGRNLYISIVEDISEEQAMLDKLKRMAEHDALTGLHNRQYFMEELERVVDRTSRKSEMKCALLYIDLDNFKFVNDTLGHLAGDRVLIEVTEILGRRMRKSDLLGRIGGDEFAIILYNVDKEQARQVADFYRQQLTDYIFKYDRRTIDIGCSIGVAELTTDIDNKEGLLARADVACQIAKRGGKNRVHVYQPDDRENMTTMREDMGWAKRIKNAIEHDKFLLACQPILDVTSNRINSYEVLVRMQDVAEQPILPAGFLPSAERFGLLIDIDRWVVVNSIKELGKLRSRGLDIKYSINLSAKAVCDIDILKMITQQIKENGVDPRAITFEITENTAIDNFDLAISFLEGLHELGCLTALDDFGVGYSSFAYLKDLPVDYVKIDGSFVKNIESDALNLAMVKSMNEVAHATGKKTVAEFVENEQGMDILKNIGVDYVQGYHIGKPLYSRAFVQPVDSDLNVSRFPH